MASPRYDSIACFNDIETLNAYRAFCREMSPEEALAKINFGSRDNARRPMPWDGGKNGGFTAAETPWIALHSRRGEINVAADLAADRSVWRFYRALLALRRSRAAFLDGAMEPVSSPDDPFFVYTRSWEGETWAVVCNFETPRQISLPFRCAAPALANLGRKTADGAYAPYECAVSRVESV